MLGRIHSVVIWTDDVRRLTPFYTEKLGLEAEMEGDDFVVFNNPQGGTQLALGRHSKTHGPAREPDRIMVNFNVNDITRTYEKLSSAGVEFTRPPSPEMDGFTLATFRDPDGNTLQLFESPNSRGDRRYR